MSTRMDEVDRPAVRQLTLPGFEDPMEVVVPPTHDVVVQDRNGRLTGVRIWVYNRLRRRGGTGG